MHDAILEDILTETILLPSHDTVKTDLEMYCTECGVHLCDVEAKDSLAVLAGVAQSHRMECFRATDAAA